MIKTVWPEIPGEYISATYLWLDGDNLNFGIQRAGLERSLEKSGLWTIYDRAAETSCFLWNGFNSLAAHSTLSLQHMAAVIWKEFIEYSTQ